MPQCGEQRRLARSRISVVIEQRRTRMTTLKRTLIATSLAAAGLLGTSGLSQAADLDVSQIYGRGSPPNAHITQGPNYRAASDAPSHEAKASEYHASDRQPVRSGATNMDSPDMDSADTRRADMDMSDERAASDPGVAGGGPSTGTTAANAGDTVTTPAGSYLDTSEGAQARLQEPAVVHEEPIDGVPLVYGRGLREGYDLHAGEVVKSEATFDVADVMGRSSPPAPENAPNFGLHV
jgi:hypothetical protein